MVDLLILAALTCIQPDILMRHVGIYLADKRRSERTAMDVSPPLQFDTELFSNYYNSAQIHSQVGKHGAEKPSRLIS